MKTKNALGSSTISLEAIKKQNPGLDELTFIPPLRKFKQLEKE
jgi:hypothetical protein